MRRILLSYVVFMMIIGSGFAQESISGQILDEAGQPIIGANLLIEEDGIHQGGTATDLDGKYELKLRKEQDLKITFLGYETLWMTLEDLLLNPVLTLKENTYNLEEIVVIANGSIIKECHYICCFCPIISSEEVIITSEKPNDALQVQWNYFPNPTTDQVNITVNQEIEGSIEIMDMQGRGLQSLIVDQWPFSINLAQYPAGTYLLRLHAEDRTELIGQVVRIE